MKDYIIATASTCDLDSKWLKEHNVPVISYTFEVDGTIYTDDCTDKVRRIIYGAMRAGKMPNTSQITSYAYYEFFKDLLEEYKTVIFADMDKAISNSYSNSMIAYDAIRQDIPDGELYIVDTSCITTGLGFLVRHMVSLKESGASAREVIDYAESMKLKIAHRFMIDDLQWLRRGGRLSNASAIVGSLLAIKPLIYLPDDGTLVSYNKVRGRKHAVHQMLEDAAAELGDPTGKEIVLSHSDCPEEGEKWKQMVMERFPEAASVTLQELGPVIGCHTGPGFLSIVYLTDRRRP